MKKSHLLKFAAALIALAGCWWFFANQLTQDALPSDADIIQTGDATGHITQAAQAALLSGALSRAQISDDECRRLFHEGRDAKSLEIYKKYALTGFFRELEAAGLEDKHIDTISDLAGLDAGLTANLRSGWGHSQLDRFEYLDEMASFFYHGGESLDVYQSTFLDQVIQQQDFGALLQALHQGGLRPNQRHVFRSLFGYILYAYPQLSSEQITQLLDAGLVPEGSALVAAIMRKLPDEHMDLLLARADDDLGSTWYHLSEPINLVTLAGKALRPRLVEHLVTRGVPLKPDFHDRPAPNLLDALPTPYTPAEHTAALQLVEIALKSQLQPAYPSTSERLGAWLPAELQQRYASLLQSELTIPDMYNEKVQQLKELLSQRDAEIDDALVVESHCLGEHQIDELAVIANANDSENLTLIRKKTWLAQQPQPGFQFISRTPDEIAHLDELYANPRWHEVVAKQISAEQAGDWEALLGLLSEQVTIENNVGAYSEALRQSLHFGSRAPEFFRDALLQRGAKPEPDAILQLARHDNVDLVRKLIPFGLDLHYVNARGENALSICLQAMRSRDMLVLLLQHG